jgi:hypothetical protein
MKLPDQVTISFFFKLTIIILLIHILAITAFMLGVKWHELLYNSYGFPKDKMVCYGHNNYLESYQTDCILPDAVKPFAFKNHLQCHTLTNQQYDQTNVRFDKTQKNAIFFTKTDYIDFTIDISKDSIIRSLDPGTERSEPYKIIINSHDIIQAVRPSKTAGLDEEHQYEFITFSKTNGKGMEVWQNVSQKESPTTNAISSFFFQCE